MKVKRQSRRKINERKRKIQHKNDNTTPINSRIYRENIPIQEQQATKDEKLKKIEDRKKKNQERMKRLRSDLFYNATEKEKNRRRIEQMRMNVKFRKKENRNDLKRLQKKRQNDQFKKNENEKKKQLMKHYNRSDEFKIKENARVRECMKRKRGQEEFRRDERIKNRIRMKIIRQREQYVINERRRTLLRNRVLRQRIQTIEDELRNNLRINRTLRQKKQYKSSELALNISRNKMLRKILKYNKQEISRNIERNRKLRLNKKYKRNEIEKNIQRIRKVRCCKEYQKREKITNNRRIKTKRLNTRFVCRETKKNARARRKNREVDVLKFRDNLYNRLLIIKDTDPKAKLQLKFIRFRAETASFVCCCCEGLFFRCSVATLNEQKIIDKSGEKFLEQINNFPSNFICNTCKVAAYHGRIYRLSTSNGLQFLKIPKCVKELSDLEERMVSPVLNFMQIRALKPYALNPQLGLKGSVVNIQVDVNDMVKILPRRFDEMQTIQIKLKRHVDHKSDYMFESIRPRVICEALRYLITTPLYEKYEVKVDEEYFRNYKNDDRPINFIVDNNDIDDNEKNNDEINRKMNATVERNEIIQNDVESEMGMNQLIDFDQINNDEVLLVDHNAEVVEEYAPIVNILAPGQDKHPMPWHKMEYLDEACYPRIFGGYPFTLPKGISYSDRMKSEARRHDRRSCIPSRILFMAKKHLEMTCSSSINICLRRTKKNADKLMNAGNVLDDDFRSNLIEFDDGFRMLKYVRSSPAYWEHKKKELLAMIRQLGKPTFFLTLSAAESHWPELLQTLMKYSEKGQTLSIKEAYDLDYNIKTDLIRNDPVTCARYFDHKVQKFMWLLRQKESIFGEYVLEDSYERVEFQQRGSPHEHMLLWLKKAPKYDKNSDKNDNDQLIDFIDRFLTCEYDENNPYIKLQMHQHGHSCYKGQKNKQCRFHIPYPVMRRTMILEPLNENEAAPKPYESIDKLMNEFYKEDISMSYDEILKKLDMTEEEYILAIRSRLKQKRVFLKRSSREVRINSYNKDILQLFESNIDIQFILDEYAVMSYVTNYISKIEGGLSKLLREAATDCDNNNNTVREKFRKISNVFLNSNLMSSQEAAYHALQLSLSKKSRKTIFINTGPMTERVRMLKTDEVLKKLDRDSTEIYMTDIFDKYCRREKELENICLADYAANYEACKKKPSKDDDENDNDDDDDEDRAYKLRQHTAVIRYRRYNLKQDSANYYREKILLFMPWRNETAEVENVDYEIVYKNNEKVIESNQAKYSVISDEVMDEALEQVEDDIRASIHEGTDGNSAAHNIDIFQQDGKNCKTNEHIQKSNAHKTRYTCPARVEESKLHDMMRKLNCKQKEFVMHILNCYKLDQVPFKIFLSGSAGVGKSTVINTLYQLVTNHFDNLPGGNMDKIIVLLCAPSGKAAFLINGVTSHSAFALPCEQYGAQMGQLSSDLANNIREKLSKMQLLIIDEISMVGCTMLGWIDTRLRQIKGVNKPFGGISVLAVGDLNQLPPVKDKPVYQVSRRNQMAPFLDINPLWNEFDFYELTEIMRQKDDIAFINALNNLALGNMTQDDVELIRSREILNGNEVPDTAIRLYATRANVTTYNAFKISKSSGNLVISTAENTFSKDVDAQTKMILLQSIKQPRRKVTIELLPKLELKINIKYMIIHNIDVEDGLVNGACGVLKLITFNENSTIPSILWLDFQLPRVGVKAKRQYHNYMENENIDQNWIPITKIALQLDITDDQKHRVMRNQFPVIPAEAITIHKSQGQTYEKICLDFTKSERRSLQMLYVALSRVTKLSGLYILGEFQISKMQTKKSATTNTVLSELTRLRNTKQLTLSYDNFMCENGPKIVYQNVGTLEKKLIHITSDRWFLRSDILVLSETLTHDNDDLAIENYRIVFRSNYSSNSRGIICYVRNTLQVESVYVEREFNVNANVELFTMKINDYHLISGYKSPKTTQSMFEKALKNIMEKIPTRSKTVLIGDFNYNLLNHVDDAKNPHYLINYLNRHQLQTKLSPSSVTTNLNTQIDVIFANFDDIDCGVYETYFSYHKPIYAILNKKPIEKRQRVIANNGDAKKKMNSDSKCMNVSNDCDNNHPNIDACRNSGTRQTVDTECIYVPDNNENIDQNINIFCEDDDYNYAITVERCKEVRNDRFYVQDYHVNFFHEIMNKQMEERGIFNLAQDVGFVKQAKSLLREIPSNATNIQIVYDGETPNPKSVDLPVGHWICTRYDGNGNVHVYDSMNLKKLTQIQTEYLDALYQFPKNYIYHSVQQQTNGVDCGVFAIFFATLLCCNKDPDERIDHNVDRMRYDVSTMLLTRTLLHFNSQQRIIANDNDTKKTMNSNIECMDVLDDCNNIYPNIDGFRNPPTKKITDSDIECIYVPDDDENTDHNASRGRLAPLFCEDDDYNYAIVVARCEELANDGFYVQDYHVNFFHEIMNKQLEERGIFNFAQDVGYVRAFLYHLQEIPRTVSNIQILYDGVTRKCKGGPMPIGHWVCTRYDGNGNVHVYDSMNLKELTRIQTDYLDALYPFPKRYIFHSVQQQTNGVDCGIFAIFFATLLCCDIEPSKRIDHNVNLMRYHVSSMLLHRRLFDFSTG